MIRAGTALAATAALLTTAPAMAQAPTPTTAAAALPFAGSAQVQALVAKARATIKPGQTNLVQKLIGVEPFVANLEYRTGPAGGGTHEKEDELFYVVDGAGTFT